MPTHDIIDNRNKKLVNHLNQILGTSKGMYRLYGPTAEEIAIVDASRPCYARQCRGG